MCISIQEFKLKKEKTFDHQWLDKPKMHHAMSQLSFIKMLMFVLSCDLAKWNLKKGVITNNHSCKSKNMLKYPQHKILCHIIVLFALAIALVQF